MGKKIAKVVLTYPPEVWKRVSPEVEAHVLGTKGFYSVTDLQKGTISAIPFSGTDPRTVFNDAVVSALKKMGVSVELKTEEIQQY